MNNDHDDDNRAHDESTHNKFEGKSDGPVFQGRDFLGDIRVESSADATRFYERMQGRLDAEHAEKARLTRQRQEAWDREWNALTKERARIRKRKLATSWLLLVGLIGFIATEIRGSLFGASPPEEFRLIFGFIIIGSVSSYFLIRTALMRAEELGNKLSKKRP
ncbi:hypothetical protein HCC61_17360 [Streptomyces sp. HNM0575]|uniref:hypothetical protein n=1 Tax=Streptomyces sp. HNM0575 TaxID=2716338 RepID=UPI00145C9A0D|nr:hypothetical protein [Streptomyces sp. HNM0575]NLU74428.1 hypothetical protein [Streptomyces sp. HNM0575]